MIRWFWWLALVLSLGVLVASLPGYISIWTVAQPIGVSFLVHAANRFGVILSLTAASSSLALAVLLFWKKSNDAMALFLSFFLLMYGVMMCGPVERAATYWVPHYPYLGLAMENILFIVPFLALILIFPNAHFVPRWSWVLLPLVGIAALSTLTFPYEESAKMNTLRAQILNGVGWLALLIALGIQVYRYRQLYTLSERQQTKWVVYGTGVWLALMLITMIPYYYSLNLPPGAPAPAWLLLVSPVWWLALMVLPFAFTLAILRSHLWDIDIVIRRTATYGLVTALLVVVFYGSVILLQRVFSTLTGSQQNELVTVLSTLAIAALFVPLRDRVQSVIDQRFFRRKYDAQQVLTGFAQAARDETDLEKLTRQLVRVVDETMHPATVSVWIKKMGGRK